MNFAFTEEQELLRSEVRKFLAEQCPMENVRRLAETPEGYSPELWKQAAELGWLGLIVPEQYGGSELQWVDLTVLLEETGRALFPSPLVSTTLAAAALIDAGSEEQRGAWLPSIVDGTRIGTLALLDESDMLDPAGIGLTAERDGDEFVLSGSKPFVADPDASDFFVVAFRSGSGQGAVELTLALLESSATGVSTQSFPTMDRTKRIGSLALDGVRIAPEAVLGEPGAAWPLIARMLDRGALAVCAELVGAAEGAHQLTIDYANERTQFGSPIGRFQSVKHPLAEMFLQLESSKSLLYYAAWALDASPSEVPRSVSLAKAYASDAFVRIGIDGVQIHGATGYTDECDIQLYLKRSKWARPSYGDPDVHYERVATMRGS